MMQKLFKRFSLSSLAAVCLFSAMALVSSSPASAAPIDNSGCNSWVRIVDVSSYQPNINWGDVARGGIAGAYIKLTEGNWYTNPSAGAQRAGAQSVGIPWGGYDYARTEVNPVTDANYFLSAGGATGTLPPVLDLEQSTLSPEATAVWVAFWMGQVKAQTGRTGVLYTGAYYPFTDAVGNALAPTGVPLWLAAYTSGYQNVSNACNTSQPSSTSSWGGWALWQYTSVGQISGINGNVDVSAVTPQWWSSVTGNVVSPPTPGVNNYPAPVITYQSTGTSVINIQSAMNFWQHSNLAIDGAYGSATASAVKQFQANFLHVSADGIWGAVTNDAYNNFISAMKNIAAASPPPPPPAPSNVAAVLTFIHACTLTTLSYGSYGPCVKFAQSDLGLRGFPLSLDASFGPATRNAVIAFQHAHGLSSDGVIGPNTWKALIG